MRCGPCSVSPAPMLIVLDTNAVLSAQPWRGTPHALLHGILRREHNLLFSSPALLEELGSVLTRPAPARRLAMIGRSAAEVLADYVDAVELVIPIATPTVVAADADDDKVVAAAVAADADLLISGDHHLLTLGSHGSIAIVNPTTASHILDLT